MRLYYRIALFFLNARDLDKARKVGLNDKIRF